MRSRNDKLKHPAASVNPDNQESFKVGKIVSIIGAIVSKFLLNAIKL